MLNRGPICTFFNVLVIPLVSGTCLSLVRNRPIIIIDSSTPQSWSHGFHQGVNVNDRINVGLFFNMNTVQSSVTPNSSNKGIHSFHHPLTIRFAFSPSPLLLIIRYLQKVTHVNSRIRIFVYVSALDVSRGFLKIIIHWPSQTSGESVV